MKKISFALVVVNVALLFFGIGYIVRGSVDRLPMESVAKEDAFVISGAYECGAETWNGGQETIMIFEDGTYIAPSGAKGTWEQIDDITIQFNLKSIQITGYIADTGIVYSGVFFEKK